MKAKGKEKTLGRILSGIDLATVKKWNPPQGLTEFCEEELNVKDDTILSQRHLTRIGNKYELWGKWVVLKAITEKGLWDDEIVRFLASGNFKDLEEELAALIIKNKEGLVPSKAVALVRQLKGYMIEFFRAINALNLPGERVYNLLMEIEEPVGWERKVADIMISRKDDIGPVRICTLIENLIIGDTEQFERVMTECGVKGGKRRERLGNLLREKHNFPDPPPTMEERVVF